MQQLWLLGGRHVESVLRGLVRGAFVFGWLRFCKDSSVTFLLPYVWFE